MKQETANKKIVQEYFDSLSKGEFDRLGSLFSDDIIWHQPGQGEFSKTYHGKAELFALFSQFMKISQSTFNISEVKSIVPNGNMVSASLHFMASKPGKSISMDGTDLMKIQDGKIKEVWLFSEDQESEDAFWVS